MQPNPSIIACKPPNILKEDTTQTIPNNALPSAKPFLVSFVGKPLALHRKFHRSHPKQHPIL